MPLADRTTTPTLVAPDLSRESDRFEATDYSILVIILFATLFAFAPALTARFTVWDDDVCVFRNPNLNPPTIQAVLFYWREPFYLYVPVVYTVWAIVAMFARTTSPDSMGATLNPVIFHAVNVLLHALAACVAYRILRSLVANRWAACAGALLFALHPLQVEAVAWVSGLKDVLAGLFSLIALWQYLRYASDDAREAGSGHAIQLVLATVAFGLALLSKPNAMALPLVAGWIDWWIYRRPMRRIAPLLVLWLAISAAVALVARMSHPLYQTASVPLWARPLLATDALAFYLCKLVWPMKLGVHYDRRAIEMVHRPVIYYSWILPIAIAALIAAMAWTRKAIARAYIAAAGVFAIALLPVLGLVPFEFQDYSTTADHYMYMPMFGIAIAVAFALRQARGRGVAIVVGIVLVVMMFRTFMQASTWRDTYSLFNHALLVNPRSGAAYNNLAVAYINDRRYDDAINECLRAIKIDAYNPQTHQNLAAALQLSGRRDAAIREYRTAIKLNPKSPQLYTGLGTALMEAGNRDEAARMFEEALRIDPSFRDARVRLQQVKGG